MLAKNLVPLTEKQKVSLVNSESISKSQKIRDLFESGLSIKEIANILNIRYNFAYNVISNFIITNNIEIQNIQKVTKKDQIIELFELNQSIKEIAINLKTNYNYVFNVIKQFKESQKSE